MFCTVRSYWKRRAYLWEWGVSVVELLVTTILGKKHELRHISQVQYVVF